jgi:transcriptional regulator with XRE-family HTH domain
MLVGTGMFIGDNLANLRIMHGYSRKQLSDMLGVTEQAVWQCENAYTTPKMQKDVWIGSAISESVAVTRLGSFNGDSNVTGNDVWSRSMSKAALVAKKAGGGKEPIGPEIEKEGLGFGYYYHYHTWNRVGGHSFF